MICKEVSDRIRGCLLGGAAGDALGYPVEFLWIDDIRKRYGPGGIQSYDFDGRTGKALISDDTQMTLFTAEGILSGLTQNRLNGTSIPLRKYVESAYADWLSTQRLGAQPPQPVVSRNGSRLLPGAVQPQSAGKHLSVGAGRASEAQRHGLYRRSTEQQQGLRRRHARRTSRNAAFGGYQGDLDGGRTDRSHHAQSSARLSSRRNADRPSQPNRLPECRAAEPS